MSATVAKQQTAFYSIARALDNFKKIGRLNMTAAKVRSRIATLQGCWAQCAANHAALLQEYPEAERKTFNYFQNDDFGAHEDQYQITLDYMQECLEELEPAVSHNRSIESNFTSAESSSLSLQHLPPIKLPPFSGVAEEWENFRDRFCALIVNNKDLSDFTRMHFLMASLTGSARESISGIKVTAENFAVAWRSLNDRFENKRRLIELHVAALHNLPKLTCESASELHSLRDKAEQSIAALQHLNRSSDDIMSDFLVYAVSQKLDPATRRAWKLRLGDHSRPPTYEELKRFISSRALALEELQPVNVKSHRNVKITSATVFAALGVSCALCTQAHLLSHCPQFVSRSPSQRIEVVKQFKRCFNCLSDKHIASECKSKFTCRKCQQKHHTMLHLDSTSSSQSVVAPVAPTVPTQAIETARAVAHSAVSLVTAPTPVVLPTAKVTVRSPSGRALIVRALLDGGSELTFITERVAQILRLARVRTHTSTSGISCVDAETCKTAALVHITPCDQPEPIFTTTAYVLKSLTKYVPRGAPLTSEWTHLSNLKLADDDPTGSTPIDLIIGSDLYNRVLINVHNGPVGQPGAIPSHFGWVLSGTTSPSTLISSSAHIVNANVVEEQDVVAHHVVAHCCSLEQQLHKFWEVEEVPLQKPLSLEERKCEEHFRATHSRAADGRYIVRLPFRANPPIAIGDSRLIAERRLWSLVRKLDGMREMKTEYADFLAEYEQLSHMTKVAPADPSNTQVVYIPHHPVIRSSSSTTRLRVVFDASSHTANGTALNTHLLAGPKLQIDLSAIILRWQQHKYVYSADIAKMYRQIWIDPRDRDYQRILWMDDKATIHEYQLLTVTYGTASAPFLALRVLQQLIEDEGANFPLATPVLRENIYVDDVLFGAEDIPLLIQTRNQVCDLLRKGGFELRKWASNRSELLADIQPANHGLACNITLEVDTCLKILGITWNPSSDAFQFQVKLPDQFPNSKRRILSTIAKLFDPLGWVAPVTLAAKVFMQRLWRMKLGWDDPISGDSLERWRIIYSALPRLNEISLPRWTGRDSDNTEMQLHGFSDASTVAYAAVVYLRVKSLTGSIKITLLAGKSKVAPLKPMTVPRLELSAAVLLARLIDFVNKSLNSNNVPIYCWTDSTVTLAWLNKHPSHWRTFVAHRVAEIQNRIPTAHWRHVPSEHNPADCASRGLLSSELLSHSLWWHGPPWLNLECPQWPDSLIPQFEEEQEAKPTVVMTLSSEDSWNLASLYSWWPKLVRVTAYIKRFVRHCKNKPNIFSNQVRHSQAVTATEFQDAKLFWIRIVQEELFPEELHALKQHKPLSSKSSLLPMSPFLDSDNIIRVGGRLENAPLPFQSKHPIILADHSITVLIVRYIHNISLHAGTQLTLATLRREFWILRGRNLVKSVIHHCVKCVRERAQIPTQLMGQLPRNRVSAPYRAFLHCGVDYAGPVATRASAGRGITSRKAYIALFVCLATRAIHLELVSDYSTPTFLNAYLRFCSRRGLPETIYSDNGTTFIGADRELQQAYHDAVKNPDFLNRTASDRTSWQFIPPHAPHFGGLWEAGVKSVKFHLRRVLGSHTLTFEEFTTVLCQIEACLNSRPLAQLTDSPDDLEPLTPGHFLIGSALTTYPEPSVLNLNENRLSRWQLVRQITERFWKLWQTDYINTLQQKAKWRKEQPSIRVGSVVLIQNSLLPPCKWELGKVTQCHKGSDGFVRVVSIKTAHSEYKRPITKLCLLPVDIETGAKVTDHSVHSRIQTVNSNTL